MGIEVRDIPELAHVFAPHRIHAYRGLTLGGDVSPADRTANTQALQAALNAASGGVLSLPPGQIVEVDDVLRIPGSLRISGQEARLVYRGPLTVGHYLLRPIASGITVDIEHLALEGPAEADVIGNDGISVIGIDCAPDTRLTLHNVIWDGWFGNAVQGRLGSSIELDHCQVQAWNSHGAGGDGARQWVVRHSQFGRIGSGRGTDHHLYINPDVWLYLEGCEFYNAEGEGNWSIHYYGSDSAPPYRVPIFRDCYFERKVFTCENEYTILDNCHFKGTVLQPQNRTLVRGGVFDQSIMLHRANPPHIRFDGVLLRDVGLNCESGAANALYQLDGCMMQAVYIDNRAQPDNHVELLGGRYESGTIDIQGTMYIGNHLHYRDAGVNLHTFTDPASITEGDVVHY